LSGFEVSPAELQSTRQFVDDVAHGVIHEVAALSLTVDGLLDGGWTGRSAAAFAGGWRDWKAGARDTLRALDVMADLLGLAQRDFADSDVFVSERFAKFSV
jgi:WXG100 family type VII secretion target